MTMHNPSGTPDEPPRSGRTPDHLPGATIEKVRLRHPRDLLAVIPYLLGFHPADSLVVVALDRGEVAMTLRVDDGALDDVRALWARLSRPLTEAGTDALAVVAYTGPDREPGVLAFAGASPWPVLDVLRAHDGRWWSLTCPNGPACCPPGEPYEPDPAVTAPLAFCGVSPAASRDELAACLRPGPAELVDAVAALLPLGPVPPDDALISALDTAHAERENGPIPLGPGQAALLLHAVGVTRVRDTCCAWHADAAWWLWTDLLHAAPPGWVTPAATLLAVTALQRGEATLAQLATDHALAADPDYRLAQLVAGLIEAAIHPRLIRDAMAYAVREAAAEAGAVRRHADHPHPTTPDTPTGTATDATDTTKETPMGTNARIEPGGYVTVDVNAWLDQRTGGPIDELTADLHRWADTHPDSDPDPGTAATPAGRNWTATARSWCQDSGFELAEADLIAHIETRLDAEVWILRAQAPASGPIAVVGINNQPPAVHADACTDSWYWFDADSVDITCPDGHGWTWSTGRELVTQGGSFTTLTVVFGPDLDAPFTPCPHCHAYQTGQRSEPCGCGGAPWIICPICGRRCDVELPTM